MSYQVAPQVGDFAATVVCDCFNTLVESQETRRELQSLLDRYMVIDIRSETEITAKTIGEFAIHLGMPRPGAPAADNQRMYQNRPSADYPFIGDLSGTPRPKQSEPEDPNYIRTLHYDGITAYSVQATFHSPPATPNLWADMRAAYRNLPSALRSVVDASYGLHASIPPPGNPLSAFPSFEDSTISRWPLRIRHPRTGEPLVFIPKNPDSRIEGLPEDESHDVINELWARVYRQDEKYTSLADNKLFVWDGVGTTHTNPAFPRHLPRKLWFFTIPYEERAVYPYQDLADASEVRNSAI